MQEKNFGPYNLKGENEESTWEGHKIVGRHGGTPIGELKVNSTYAEDWSTIEGILKPKLPGIKGKYFMKRVKVSDEEVVYEGYSKMMGFDGIIITGKSDRPVYIEIENGNATIEDASHLWETGRPKPELLLRLCIEGGM